MLESYDEERGNVKLCDVIVRAGIKHQLQQEVLHFIASHRKHGLSPETVLLMTDTLLDIATLDEARTFYQETSPYIILRQCTPDTIAFVVNTAHRDTWSYTL